MNEFWRKLCDATETDNYILRFADPNRRVVHVDNYTYSVDGESLAANITQTQSQEFDIIMDDDSDFVLQYFSGFGRAAGGSVMILNPAILVQIRDQSSGRSFFNRSFPMPLMAGQGGFPFLLTSPRVIRPRSTLEVSAISAQNQAFSGFYFSLHGSRIYYA